MYMRGRETETEKQRNREKKRVVLFSLLAKDREKGRQADRGRDTEKEIERASAIVLRALIESIHFENCDIESEKQIAKH